MGDCWIIGPIAWDNVAHVPHLPERGGFVQADTLTGRPGGAGANVALALASTGVHVHMTGYAGADEPGDNMRAVLTDGGIDITHVQRVAGRTSEVLIMIEPDGERTMIGLHPDLLHTVTIPAEAIQPGDIAYFAAWREEFLPEMGQIEDNGALVITVPNPHMPAVIPASYLVGSHAQYDGQDPAHYLAQPSARLRAAAVTRAAEGAVLYQPGSVQSFPARQVTAVDTTGAGDAFASGFIHQIASGGTPAEAITAAIDWSAAAVQEPGSIPPPWDTVHRLFQHTTRSQ
jgi:ribokinase